MLACNHCHELFTEYELRREDENLDGNPMGFVESRYECPYCGSTDIEDAVICSACGAYCAPSEMVTKGTFVCNSCFEDYRDDPSMTKEFIRWDEDIAEAFAFFIEEKLHNKHKEE